MVRNDTIAIPIEMEKRMIVAPLYKFCQFRLVLMALSFMRIQGIMCPNRESEQLADSQLFLWPWCMLLSGWHQKNGQGEGTTHRDSHQKGTKERKKRNEIDEWACFFQPFLCLR